jgi:hypothetical protein
MVLDGTMDLGTKIVVLIAASIGLGTAVILYRAAKLKHDSEAHGATGGATKREPRPFDDMFKVLGSFGAVLGPMLMIFLVYIIFASGFRFISAFSSSSQAGDVPENSQTAVVMDRKLLNPKEIRLFDLAMTAADMSGGRDRSEALRHAADVAISERAYSIALMAAMKMQGGRDRSEALALVALKAAEDNDQVTAGRAIRAMATGRDRDDVARGVMSILEGRKAKETK